MWARASLFRRFTNTNVYQTGSVKVRKNRHKIFVDIRIFLQCTAVRCVCNLYACVDVMRARTWRGHVSSSSTRGQRSFYNVVTDNCVAFEGCSPWTQEASATCVLLDVEWYHRRFELYTWNNINKNASNDFGQQFLRQFWTMYDDLEDHNSIEST